MLKIILVDEKEDCITLHAVAEESFANIDMKCVFAEDKLTTAVTKIEDGYKLKYDVYQVNRKKKMKNRVNLLNFLISKHFQTIFRSNVEMYQKGISDI